MNFLEKALELHVAGLKIIPVNEDKTPCCKWKAYSESQSKEDVESLFANDCWGIALLTGNGIEALDIDLKNDATGKLMLDFTSLLIHDSLGDSLTSKAYIQSTVNGGYHYIYKSSFKDGNQKLASRPTTEEEEKSGERCKVLFETRGEGGYVIISPTPGYKAQTGSLSELETVTDTERNFLLDCCRSFNTYFKKSSPLPKGSTKQNNQTFDLSGKLTPWQDFNNKNDHYAMLDLLTAVGWFKSHETSERIYLRRPGKTSGISADIHLEKNLFKVFSTSTEFDIDTAYSPFAVYAMMNHAGDFSAAAKALYNEGYGDRYESKPSDNRANELHGKSKMGSKRKEEQDSKFQKILNSKFDYNAPIENIKTCLNYDDRFKQYKIGSFGTIGAIVGIQKSRKTTLLKAIIASGLGFKNQLNFSFDLGGKNVIYFDTEQPYDRFQMTCRDILNMADIRGNDDRFNAFALRSLSRKERVDFIKQTIPLYKNIGLIVIDGIVDICEDYLNSEKSQDTLELLMQMADSTNAMIITVLHLTKGAGHMRGFLGSELGHKCDFAIEVTRDDFASTVKCRESRFSPFPSFDIRHNDEGYPELVDNLAIHSPF